MKVATWHGGTKFTVDTVPDPSPGPGEVLVKIDTCGICGTDVHITQGLFPSTPPRVLGHEYSGVVAAVGKGVKTRKVGDKVACEPSSYCGTCIECKSGRSSRCVNARGTGGYAQYAALTENATHLLPEGLGLAESSLLEPASCCLVGLERSRMKKGDTVLVIGGGNMGLLTMAFAKLRGAGTVIMSELSPERRAMAKQLGADILHDPKQEPLKAVVDRATGGRGVDLAVEAVGKPELIDVAIQMVKPRGEVEILGVPPKGSRLPSDLFDTQFKEVSILGVFGRGDGASRVLPMLAKLNLKGMISGRYPLERINEGFAASAGARGVKFAIAPNG
jgi:L-iditol 2-dehydrogenase